MRGRDRPIRIRIARFWWVALAAPWQSAAANEAAHVLPDPGILFPAQFDLKDSFYAEKPTNHLSSTHLNRAAVQLAYGTDKVAHGQTESHKPSPTPPEARELQQVRQRVVELQIKLAGKSATAEGKP